MMTKGKKNFTKCDTLDQHVESSQMSYLKILAFDGKNGRKLQRGWLGSNKF
jgi:hypothetical protein